MRARSGSTHVPQWYAGREDNFINGNSFPIIVAIVATVILRHHPSIKPAHNSLRRRCQRNRRSNDHGLC
ncbi:hypothetical protein AGR7A_Lc120789 [Agrobacterium deltaense NCPPB 1641]|uniref:Uncharacterized protein n=1 Tax=Agrobacterium deltaense NCPPB 1641 TaxID=1183425 RepID=A0A1S7TZQ1_9HYPH|nr:hypothetical protein AGR7A_Lc120789 [Agrobacterium deltaense NCPPB 1641]